MKRLGWLLVLPYVVKFGTVAYSTEKYYQLSLATGKDGAQISCSEKSDCKWMYDIATALNDANEHRMAEEAPVNTDPPMPVFSGRKGKFDNKSACGKDDCGQD